MNFCAEQDVSNEESPTNERKFFALATAPLFASVSRHNDPSFFCYSRNPDFVMGALLLKIKDVAQIGLLLACCQEFCDGI